MLERSLEHRRPWEGDVPNNLKLVSFVSITQSFNTTSSMGRLTLNVLLSFAQFEREVIGERVPASGHGEKNPRRA